MVASEKGVARWGSTLDDMRMMASIIGSATWLS
jgi:hypothetical protein